MAFSMRPPTWTPPWPRSSNEAASLNGQRRTGPRSAPELALPLDHPGTIGLVAAAVGRIGYLLG